MNTAAGNRDKILPKDVTNMLLEDQNKRRKDWGIKHNQLKYPLRMKVFSNAGKLKIQQQHNCSTEIANESP